MMQLRAHIVKRRKESPCVVRNSSQLNLDDRSSLKTPPSEARTARVIHPVRLKPVFDVVVTRRHHQADTIALSDVPLRGMRSDARNLPVNDGCELVDDNESVRLQ
jgi:hypothetical protein